MKFILKEGTTSILKPEESSSKRGATGKINRNCARQKQSKEQNSDKIVF